METNVQQDVLGNYKKIQKLSGQLTQIIRIERVAFQNSNINMRRIKV